MRKPKSPIHPVDAYAGERLRYARRERGISQARLARSPPESVTFQQIQKYERGDNRMSVSRLHDIAHSLGVPVAYFLPKVECQTIVGKKEQALLKCFNRLSENRKNALLSLLDNGP